MQQAVAKVEAKAGVKMSPAQGVELSPLQRYIPYMNWVLALVIGLAGRSWSSRRGAASSFSTICWVPLSEQ